MSHTDMIAYLKYENVSSVHAQMLIIALCRNLEKDNYSIVRYYELGTSVEGRPIPAVHISESAHLGLKPTEVHIGFLGNIHGNEVSFE
jgi:hypothetical protein